MVWEGYWSRLCKCNDFNVYGLFGRDNLLYSPLMFKNFDICPQCRAKGLPGTLWRVLADNTVIIPFHGSPLLFCFISRSDAFLSPTPASRSSRASSVFA